MSRVTPREFEETYVRVYCRYKLQKKVAMAGFKQVNYCICIDLSTVCVIACMLRLIDLSFNVLD